MTDTINLEPLSDEEKQIERAKIMTFCYSNGYQFEDDGETIVIYIPLFKDVTNA